MAPFKPYAGPARKLVLGIDVGTTYSGISYAILDPGEIPKIQGITRYLWGVISRRGPIAEVGVC